MPLALVIAGLVLAVTAFRGTYGFTTTDGSPGLAGLLENDLASGGSKSFLPWIGALIIIGMLGYIPKFETPSRALLALILLAMFLANGGFFSQLQSSLQSATAQPAPTNQEPKFTGALPITLSGGSNPLSGVTGAASGVSSVVNGINSVGSLFGA